MQVAAVKAIRRSVASRFMHPFIGFDASALRAIRTNPRLGLTELISLQKKDQPEASSPGLIKSVLADDLNRTPPCRDRPVYEQIPDE